MKYLPLLLALVLTACPPSDSGNGDNRVLAPKNALSFRYSGAITAQVGIAIPDSVIEAADGFILSDYTYTISPELNAGLRFSATDGAISGTPTAVQPETEYTVTANLVRGSGAITAKLRIAVEKGSLPTATITLSYAASPAKLTVTLNEKPNAQASNYPMVKEYRLQYRQRSASADWGEWTDSATAFALDTAISASEEIEDTVAPAMVPDDEAGKGDYSYRLLSAVKDEHKDHYESTGGDWVALLVPAQTNRRLVAVFRKPNVLGLALTDATSEPTVDSYKVQFQKGASGAWEDTRLAFASTDAVGTVVVLTDTSTDMVPDSAGDVANYKYRLATVPAERRTHTPGYSAEAAPKAAPSISYYAASIMGKVHSAKIQNEATIGPGDLRLTYTPGTPGSTSAIIRAYTYSLLDSAGTDSNVLALAGPNITADGSSSPLAVGTYTVKATPIADGQPNSNLEALAGGELRTDVEVFDKLEYTLRYTDVPEQMKFIDGSSKLLKNVNFSGSALSFNEVQAMLL